MTLQHDYRRVMEIFDEVCDLPTGEREAALDQHCGDDAAIRAQVRNMLAHDATPVEPLRNGAVGGGLEVLAADFAPDVDPSAVAGDQVIPARIGQYRIIRKLGEGGMGVVYLAEQTNPQRAVALKVIRQVMTSTAALRRFEHEAHVLGLLAHPGIAQIFEAGTARPVMADGSSGGPPQPFFAMEFIDGQPLNAYAESHSLAVRQRLELMIRICEAVEHAHQKGVIHRDLKPSNILVVGGETKRLRDEETERQSGAESANARINPTSSLRLSVSSSLPLIKILDFGVARLVSTERQVTTLHTSAGQLMGTLQYMSPEQVQGDHSTIDRRSDVYALGVILFEFLSGKPPYIVADKSVPEAVSIVLEDHSSRIRFDDRELRGDVETIVRKAVERNPARRFQSAAELADDLRRFLDHQPIVARPASGLYRARKFAQRHTLAVTLGSITALALIAATIVSAVFAFRANRTADSEAYQRRVAEDASGLLLSVLTLPDPHSSGEDTTVVELLDALVHRLDTQADVLPEVEVEVRSAAADTYMGLKRSEQAREQLGKAISLQRAIAGNDLALGKLLNSYGLACQMSGASTEAEPAFREAIDILRRFPAERERNLGKGLANLATTLEAQGRLQEAEPLFVEAHELLEARGDDPLRTIGSLRYVARLHARMKLYEKSEAEYRKALAMVEAAVDQTHPILSATLYELGWVQQLMGREAVACPTLERAWSLASASRAVGSTDWKTIHGELLKCYVALDRRGQALQHASDGLRALEIKFGPDHELVVAMRDRVNAFANDTRPETAP